MANIGSIPAASMVATAVVVICPHCAQVVPDPETGSEYWEARQLPASSQTLVRTCPRCNKSFKLTHPLRVQLEQ